MSQQLRQLKTRIRSIEGTWKVTRAMEMVSMSKFKGLDSPLQMGRRYYEKINSLFSNLVAVEGTGGSRYLKPSSGKGAVGILVITADTGLCSGYSDRAIRMAENFIKEHEGRSVKLYVYGRKGQTHFRKESIPVEKAYAAVHGKPRGNFHGAVLDDLMTDYDSGKIEEIHVVYTKFHNAMRHVTTLKQFLPIEAPKGIHPDVIIESSGDAILPDIVPLYISSQLRLMMLESLTSEHAARMVAMKAAKDNAKELVGDLVLLRNKMRQAMITREVIEIISSAEALKG